MSFGYKEHHLLFGNGRRENIGFTINAGQSVTLYFQDNGTDSDNAKYFNLGSAAKKVSITNNKIAVITHIQNEELKTPRTLGTATANTFSSGIEWGSIVVAADQDSTVFEVYAD